MVGNLRKMTNYLSHASSKSVTFSVRTFVMVMIYTSTECENVVLKTKSEHFKFQIFRFARTVGKNDHYFRSYISRKILKIVYELPLYLCF